MMMPLPLRGAGRPQKDHSPDELHLAVLTGRCKRIKNLLRKGVHIESVNSHGQTPLFCASWGGDLEVVCLLLCLGANPNRRCGSEGATPSHAACYRGSRRVLRRLLESGADVTLRDNRDRTPRDYAEKQPAPLRRQKILAYLDLVLGMTLHRRMPPTVPDGAGVAASSAGAPSVGSYGSGTLGESRASLNKSSLSLSKKGVGSVASVWGACVGVNDINRDQKKENKNNSATLTKSVSCHLLDQLCVTTSLPLLTPSDLQKPPQPSVAYTCGGPTVYSPHTWLGTPVTVRRPTPALAMTRTSKTMATGGKPDQHAVVSLLEELAILRRLRHPAFLEVMAACHVTSPTPDHVTLVFQHVPYGSLYHHLHVMHRDLSMLGAVDLLTGIVEGLLFLHAHSWLHSGLSSHSLHLVSPTHAKLGSFEHAIQIQAKGGCSMKADELGRASWLVPWQAPETLQESMVSVKSEVYSFAAVIWEIWSGMPPWSGITEEDIKKRVCQGESLPYLRGSPPSLVMYLTQYGLKWNAHERDLDFHEIHTMLKSLRVQVDEEERVPPVTSWGPPSVPNTPVIGRLTQPLPQNLSELQLNSKNNNNPTVTTSSSMCSLTSSPLISASARTSAEIHPSQYLHFVTIDQSLLSSTSSSCSSVNNSVNKRSGVYQPYQSKCINSSFGTDTKDGIDEKLLVQMKQHPSDYSVAKQHVNLVQKINEQYSFLKTPSPASSDVLLSNKNLEMVTSTPMRHSMKADLPPDLLPSKFVPSSTVQPGTPDVLTRGLQDKSNNYISKRSSAGSSRFKLSSNKSKAVVDSDSDSGDFAYISNSAKRAFFTDSDDSKSPSPTNSTVRLSAKESKNKDSGTVTYNREIVTENIVMNKKKHFEAQDPRDVPLRSDIVRRGLSLSNLLNLPGTSVITRTFSHVSLCSAESSGTCSSSGGEGRKPQRTISQVTLTFKKLSTADSSSSSSRDELEQVSDRNNAASATKYQKSKSLLKTPQNCKSPRHSDDVTGIKPASHQLTRHSSSCSLSSGGPPSPVHQFVGGPAHSVLASAVCSSSSSPSRGTQNSGSMPSSPQRSSNSTLRRPVSREFGGSTANMTETVRVNPRRHSDNPKSRNRKQARHRQEIEPEEEFIDDEFNAALFDQPHMQLSVGSSENLLDSRLGSPSMMADDAGVFSTVLSIDGGRPKHRHMAGHTSRFNHPMFHSSTSNSRHSTLNALPENSDEDLSLTFIPSSVPGLDLSRNTTVESEKDTGMDSQCCKINTQSNIVSTCNTRCKNDIDRSESNSTEINKDLTIISDCESVSNSSSDLKKDFEPLKSVQLLRNMGKSLSLYLPKHSLGSESDCETL